jgi:hypothetical protein
MFLPQSLRVFAPLPLAFPRYPQHHSDGLALFWISHQSDLEAEGSALPLYEGARSLPTYVNYPPLKVSLALSAGIAACAQDLSWGPHRPRMRQTPHGIKGQDRGPRRPTSALPKHRPTRKTQRKGRLVWEETPFLTHPGAGIGWVAR